MVKILLTNQKKDSLYKTAELDIVTGNYLINNEKSIDKTQFKDLDFVHPLFIETPLSLLNNSYRYCYHNLEELLLLPRRVYATLIQHDNSTHCHFTILPSPVYYKQKASYEIPFSVDYHKAARETINVNQLNAIVSHFSRYTFQFQDKYIIKTELAVDDLPVQVNADLFYKKDAQIHQLLNQADNFDKLELRYINSFIGFGVYCRQDIDKGEGVLLYCGMKKREVKKKNYFFYPKLDSFAMGIDAREYGNTARFVNHAPEGKNTDSQFLAANLSAVNYSIYGIEVVALFAVRPIKKGEQLLVDYSQEYFIDTEPLRFKLNGNLVDANNQELHDSRGRKMAMLQVFARSGIKRAFIKLLNRFIITLALVLIFALLVKALS